MKKEVIQKSHYKEIDFLYALGAVLTILGHSHPNDWSTFPGEWIEFIYLFHMPLFFAIAGFLLASSKGIEQAGYGRWLMEKGQRLLTPYFVLSLLALVPKYILEYGSFEGLTFKYLIFVFFVPRQNVWGHFWFLPVLFLMYAVFGVYRNCEKYVLKFARKMAYAGIIAFALFIHFEEVNIEWFGISDICNFFIYFILGYAIYGIYPDMKNNLMPPLYALFAVVLFSLSLFVWTTAKENKFLNFVISLLMLLCCCVISKPLSNKKPIAVDFISRNVFTFYIYSWPAQAVAERLCSHIGMPWLVITLVMFVSGVACPTVIILIYRKCTFLHCKFADLVLGMRR